MAEAHASVQKAAPAEETAAAEEYTLVEAVAAEEQSPPCRMVEETMNANGGGLVDENGNVTVRTTRS